jgi:serine/threonine-protein kinase
VSPVPSSRVGEILADKYRVVRYIGEGGMGTVYEAQHEVVGRRFAVKFLHSELAQHREILDRFKREARAAGALESENIASVIDFGQAEDGIPYLVMELLLGEDLAHLLAREAPLPVFRAVNLVVQACRGVEAAHAAGIIHRDLKPENLFVCRRGDGSDLVKILDFGIAKLALAGDGGLPPSTTQPGSAIGTPSYMPPEQARGEKEIDHRADIYGLGAILFEALGGQKPHPGDSYNVILYHILTQPPVSLAALRPGLPAGLPELVHRALASDPSSRPASAKELAQALSPYAGQQALRTGSQLDLRVTRRSAPRPEPALAAAPASASPTLAIDRRRRGRWLAAAATVLLAVGAAALLVRPWVREPPAGSPSPGRGPMSNPRTATAQTPAGPDLPPRPADPTEEGRGATAPARKLTAEGSPGPARAQPTRPENRPRTSDRRRPRGPVFDPRNPYR